MFLYFALKSIAQRTVPSPARLLQDTGVGAGGGYDSLGAGSDDANSGVWTYPPDNSFLPTAARQPFPAYTPSGLGASSSVLKQQQQSLDRWVPAGVHSYCYYQ